MRVVATDDAVHVWWDTQTGGPSSSFTLWSSMADLSVPTPAFDPPAVTILNAIHAAGVGLPGGGVRLVAATTGPFVSAPSWRDLVVVDRAHPDIVVTGLTAPQGVTGTVRVTVTAGGAPVGGGDLFLSLEGTVRDALLDSSGTATFTVPGTLAVGPHEGTLVFSGTPDVDAATEPVTYVVTAAGAPPPSAPPSAPPVGRSAATVRAKVTTTPTTTRPGAVRVTVTGGAATPTGKVTVTLRLGHRTASVRGALKGGRATLLLPKLVAGPWKGTATYAGDAVTAPGDDTVKVVVR